MSAIPEISNPYIGALAFGVLYGLAVCTASCLPYISSYIAGTGANFRRGVSITLIFSGGRIVAYAIIGGVAGLLTGLFSLIATEVTISPFQVYSSIAFAAITIAIGAWILFKARKPSGCSIQEGGGAATVKTGKFGVNLGAFTLGLSRGLILCPPLILLLSYSLPFSSPIGTVAIAVLFGLGTTLSPILLLGGVMGWLLNKAPLFRKWISVAGGVVLIVLGVITIVNSVIQL